MTSWTGHALVTGASRGLGAEISRQLAARGHRVSMFSRDVRALERLQDEIRASGGKAAAYGCDVACSDDVRAAISACVSEHGPIETLINNAGVVEPIELIRHTNPSDWARHIAVNLMGAFNMLHHAAAHLSLNAVVINVSSGASAEPIRGRSAYCASKAGLNMLSGVFALEESYPSRRVYAFTPGPTDTDIHRIIREAPINAKSGLRPPALRPVSESARILLWLCSEAAADLAGQFVDGRDPSIAERASKADGTQHRPM